MTVYSGSAWRVEKIGTKPSGVNTPAIFFIPEGVIDLTIFAIASAAGAGKVEETYSSPAAIGGGTAVWMDTDSTLNTIGLTGVRYQLGQRTPVALRVTCATDNETATMVVVGKRVR